MNSITPEICEQIMAYMAKEIEQKTFKIEKMSEYVQQAKEYAEGNSSLFERILNVLNSLEFQTNQIEYLKEWDKSLIISLEPDMKTDVLYTCIKIDKTFDFFKENFYWT